jgi:hypothetical protein
MKITVTTVKAKDMRYPSLGDYGETPAGDVWFKVVDLGDWRFEALVALHEIVEYLLVKAAGIPVLSIDAFDIAFEQDREIGINGPDEEPGDSIDAPYHLQHGVASGVERVVAAMMGVAWADYAHACDMVVFPSVKKMGKRR